MPVLRAQKLNRVSSSAGFYAGLQATDSFDDIANPKTYFPLPPDWTLLVADVVGSTAAIERGAYKTVNMVGAASIICVLNICEAVPLPFMFGGDGGLIAVPPELADPACREMKRLQMTSSNMFGLELRTAAIPVSELRNSGADTLVKKVELSPGNTLAMFAGDGPALADDWLKADPTSKGYALQPEVNDSSPDLEGLSCRWEPLQSQNGVMLTTIIIPGSNQGALEKPSPSEALETILDGRTTEFAPARDATMRFRFPPRGIAMEIAAGAKQSSLPVRIVWVYFTSLMQAVCERIRCKIGNYDGATYRKEVQSNTDFRKFDGALRMVLDVSVKQADQIEAYLEKEYLADRLCYGTWRSKSALMTCLLFDLAESQHIHFIDGADGGYAMAAKQLKKRKAALANQ